MTSNNAMAVGRVSACPPTGRPIRSERDRLGRCLGILVSIGMHGAIALYAACPKGKAPAVREPVRIEFIAVASVVATEARPANGGEGGGPPVFQRKKRVRRGRPRAIEPRPEPPGPDTGEGSVVDPLLEPGESALGAGEATEAAVPGPSLNEAGRSRHLSNVPPSVREGPAPRYPAWARRAGVSGRVCFRVLVSAVGTVARILVAESSGNRDLDAEAARVIAGWRFHPASRDGVPAESWVLVPVESVLE